VTEVNRRGHTNGWFDNELLDDTLVLVDDIDTCLIVPKVNMNTRSKHI